MYSSINQKINGIYPGANSENRDKPKLVSFPRPTRIATRIVAGGQVGAGIPPVFPSLPPKAGRETKVHFRFSHFARE